MDTKLTSVNRLVKSYDGELYAIRTQGMIQVYRDSLRWETHDLGDFRLLVSRPSPDLVICLTDTWTVHGKIADWGLEPLSAKLREMDGWNRATIYEEFDKARDLQKRDAVRARNNENRALAADLRRDFAKATNDINVSSIEKTDARRKVK